MSRKLRGVLAKTGVLLAVLMIAFLASGVVLAQSSSDYDLGCRAELTAGGSAFSYPGVGVTLHSSVGQWNAGRTTIQGSGIILESGYILPVGQGQSASASASEGIAPAETQIDGDVFLPALYSLKVIRYVRPCNWPWASTAQAAR